MLPRYTLKDANTFLLADALGDIQGSDDGLFTNDTRVLSRLELAIAGRRPSLLGAAINQDNTVFTAHLTNRPLAALGALALPLIPVATTQIPLKEILQGLLQAVR